MYYLKMCFNVMLSCPLGVGFSGVKHCFNVHRGWEAVGISGGPCSGQLVLLYSRSSRITSCFRLVPCRTLTDRQKSLLMSYAEDEGEVDGTVNGVTATTTGTLTSFRTQTLMWKTGAVMVSGQLEAAALCWFINVTMMPVVQILTPE